MSKWQIIWTELNKYAKNVKTISFLNLSVSFHLVVDFFISSLTWFVTMAHTEFDQMIQMLQKYFDFILVGFSSLALLVSNVTDSSAKYSTNATKRKNKRKKKQKRRTVSLCYLECYWCSVAKVLNKPEPPHRVNTSFGEYGSYEQSKTSTIHEHTTEAKKKRNVFFYSFRKCAIIAVFEVVPS